MSPADRVVRFERSDETGAFVLVHVSHQGPALLDLTLTATEGESPYVSLGGSELQITCIGSRRLMSCSETGPSEGYPSQKLPGLGN